MYQLTEDVEDLLLTHLFDTRRQLELKVKTLSSEPERLSAKDIERLVSIICEYAVKYRVLYSDQRDRYRARQNYQNRRMRANMNACMERKRQRTMQTYGRVPLDQINSNNGYPFGFLSQQDGSTVID